MNFRTAQDTVNCIESLLRFGVVSSSKRIVVVDNNSGDDSISVLQARVPKVTLIASPINSGFGGGVNTGIDRCSTDFVLVLNPDTRFIDGSIASALDHFKDPKVGIVGLNLMNEDGTEQHAARTFYSLSTVLIRRTPLHKVWRLARQLNDEHLKVGSTEIDVPWVIGAGFIVRRDLFTAIGGMDERFFLYLEDTDLCRRVWHAGFKVQIARGATLIHSHRRESGSSPFSRKNLEHLKSLLRYTSKYGLPVFGHDKK